jgi:heterodisulfide reductase subunit C
MDILPNQIIRYAQLGFKEELLNCNAIWVCASCLTCNSRCPKGINIAEIIEALRQYLLRERKDHIQINEVPGNEKELLPPIALISSMRKYSS